MLKALCAVIGIREVLFLGGLGAVTAGAWLEFGMAYGLITAGAVLLFVAVRGVG